MFFTGLYLQAVTHPSYVKENGGAHNEILEFLGDSVLQLCISDLLLDLYPEASEGELTQMRHQLVNNETLAKVARWLQIGRALRLGKGELRSGGRDKDGNLANAMEALLGALYQNVGLPSVRTVIDAHWKDLAKAARHHVPAKRVLHEWAQKNFQEVPRYEIISTEGAEHNLTFVMKLCVNGQQVAIGRGPSKKKASIAAAEAAVIQLALREHGGKE